MTWNSICVIAAGPLRLQLNPSIGGSISAFERIEGEVPRSILRKCNSPLEKVLEASSFPLIPYVNRVRGGRFTSVGAKSGSGRTSPAIPVRSTGKAGCMRGRSSRRAIARR